MQQCPLTELISFKEPQLDAGGLTSLGAGLELLSQCIENEVVKKIAYEVSISKMEKACSASENNISKINESAL